MLADTNGTLSSKDGLDPFLNFVMGVRRSTFAGTVRVVVRPGMIRNSEKVLDTSPRIFATVTSLCG
jgi:hypothetical protein